MSATWTIEVEYAPEATKYEGESARTYTAKDIEEARRVVASVAGPLCTVKRVSCVGQIEESDLRAPEPECVDLDAEPDEELLEQLIGTEMCTCGGKIRFGRCRDCGTEWPEDTNDNPGSTA